MRRKMCAKVDETKVDETTKHPAREYYRKLKLILEWKKCYFGCKHPVVVVCVCMKERESNDYHIPHNNHYIGNVDVRIKNRNTT